MKKRPVYRRKPALVSHHSTTGKKLPREHTSYALLVFLLLIIGSFMSVMTFKANASDYSVHAAIYAPLPTVPAVIVTPADGTHFAVKPITVDGTCQSGDIVRLYRNNVFSSEVLCALDGTFQAQTDLFDGANDLEAKVFNITDNQGPVSPIVRVYYDPPIPPVTGGGNSGGTPPADITADNQAPAHSTTQVTASAPANAFILNAENIYKAYYVGETAEWKLDVEGGSPPYAFSVAWGDGKNDLVSRKESGEFTVKHVYKKAPGSNGVYAIRITGSDYANHTTLVQLMVLIHDKNASAFNFSGSVSSDNPPSLKLPFQARYIWPAYAVTLLMAVSFWLGQHGAVLHLRPRTRLHKR